jgi:predicted nucleic acid-binding protein
MLSTIYYIAIDKKVALSFLKMIEDEWNIVPYGKETIRKALTFSLDNTTDLEDTLQCLCAKANGCQYVITNDKKFVDCGVDIVNYERFLK